MNVPRRRILQGVAAASVAGSTGLAGCSSFDEVPQLLVVTNETESRQTLTVTIRRSPDDTTNETTITADASATTTPGTSPRFVVDFDYELGPGDRRERTQALPKDGSYEVVAVAPDVGTGRGSYVDTESVRVTIENDAVAVESFRAE